MDDKLLRVGTVTLTHGHCVEEYPHNPDWSRALEPPTLDAPSFETWGVTAAFSRLLPCMTKLDPKFQLNGMQILPGAEPDTLELAATDGHRLGVMNAWGRLPEGIERVFIPKAACSLMAKWGQALRITPPQPGSQLWLCSDFDGWIVGLTLAEDGVRFPDYRRISGIMVPDGNGGFHIKGERTLILDRAALLLAVNTVLPATIREDERHSLRVSMIFETCFRIMVGIN